MDGLQERDWKSKVTPTVTKDQAHDYLRNLNMAQSVGLDDTYPRDLRELADVVAIIFEKSWQTGEDPSDWKKGNIASIFEKGRKKDSGNY